MFIDFREKKGGERERDRERNINVRNIDWLVAPHTYPNMGLHPQPRYVPWVGTKPTTFWCTKWCYNPLSHPAKADSIFMRCLEQLCPWIQKAH